MTGPDHYRRAEQLATQARGQEGAQANQTLALAQVHATLALAAATVPARISGYRQTRAAWDQAAGIEESHEEADGDE